MTRYQLKEIWQKILATLEPRLSKHSYETWIIPLQPLGYSNNTIFFRVPDSFTRDWVVNHYSQLIKTIIRNLINEDVQLEFLLNEEIPESLLNRLQKSSPGEKFLENVQLHPRYTFETFVVGNSNRFAHAACMAVAESPAAAYNPLFIYGGVGLGKTHLMHAIGHYIIKNNQSHKVVYVTTEKFTNDLISAIREDDTEEFRSKYRSIDVLLVDDIQFLAKKERTQEEFFHTFNTLYEANRQIIISSDRPPRDIPTLEDRLRSRFEWGLITDIQPPDLETRIAILQKKAQLENLEIPLDTLAYIAGEIDSNIRELEGALIKLIAYASLYNCEMSCEVAREALKDYLSKSAKPKQINISLIQKVVAERYSLRPEDLRSKKRTREIAFPRQVAMYLARKLLDASLPKIGEEFGGRDHSTVVHAIEKITEQIKTDYALQTIVAELEEKIKQ
ncbi:MAG: chromosomal replication initiator protein DnaA [Armatimonadetes bacterium]|nr:chromosomal replication initiator protein DnaA [Armatimonadota bacterium]